MINSNTRVGVAITVLTSITICCVVFEGSDTVDIEGATDDTNDTCAWNTPIV